jgi:Ca-activated chloride channel family protein
MTNEKMGLMTTEGLKILLKGVDVEGDITGRAAKITVRQLFENNDDKAVEAVYKFPLPEDSSVCGFRAIIGDRVIQGQVEEKEAAFKLYDDALSQGHGAYLLDEERPNIFTLSVGNLKPKTAAVVEISYVAMLETNSDDVRFCLPTTISPRYLPKDTPDEEGIPAAEKINPEFSLSVPYGLRLKLNIHGKEQIKSVESPSHHIATQFSDTAVNIEFSSGVVAMDRDFVLNIKYVTGLENRAFVSHSGNESFIQLDFNPGAIDPASAGGSTNREIIFVLDCSGSMQGPSIVGAKLALEVLLKAIDPETFFNIYRFGSTFESFFKSSILYDDKSLTQALIFLSKVDADLGGTEIMTPLQAILEEKMSAPSRNIILITDGQVGNENDVMALVQSKAIGTRLFTVGIGHGPNEYFIKELARITGGAAEMITPYERIEPKILRLFGKVMSVYVDRLTIELGAKAEQAPLTPIVYLNEVKSIFARIDDSSFTLEKVKVSGNINGQIKEWMIGLSPVAGDIPIPYLWARERIREIEDGEALESGSRQILRKDRAIKAEIIKISKYYGIISRETSFLAVETRKDSEKYTGEIVLRKVSIMLTHGWHGIVSHDSGMLHQSVPEWMVKYQIKPRKSLEELSVPSFMRQPKVIFGRRQASPTKLRSAPSYESVPPVQKTNITSGGSAALKRSDRDDLLLQILSLQLAEGGFKMNETVADLLKLSFDALKDAANHLEIKKTTDKFVLLSTAVVLTVLEDRFAKEEYFWRPVIRKSEAWLKAELAFAVPLVDGEGLTEWAKEFVSK